MLVIGVALELTRTYLEKCDAKFVVLGAKKEGNLAENVYGYPSGGLSDAFIRSMVENSMGIVFPSVYEGFGLPFLDGIKYDKKLIVTDNELNRELRNFFENYSSNVFLYKNPDELPQMVEDIKKDPKVVYAGGVKKIRTWTDSATELEAFIARLLKTPVDKEVLARRWNDCRYLENVHRMYATFSKPDNVGAWLGFKIWLRDNTPGLFRFLHNVKRIGRK